MMRTVSTLLVLAVSLTGCSKSSSSVSPNSSDQASVVESVQPAVAPRVQLDNTLQTALAKDIDATRVSGKWAALRQRWQGQHVTWDVTRYNLLCRSAARCNVAAFKVPSHSNEGWMPELSLTADEYAKIEAACGKTDCALKIDGTVAELRGSEAEPASLRIGNVKVVSASRG
jgi:hypothetical protein